MRKEYQFHLIILGFYSLLALILTWPLPSHLATHIPGEATWAFDESTFIWNMWWLKYSLLTLQQSPLASDYIFYPLGIRLTTYTFNLFHAAWGLPLQLIFSLPVANNLSLLFSYISSAYGTFLLTLYLLHQPDFQRGGRAWSEGRPPALQPAYLAAFIAGTVYAFSASRMMYVALGHYNFVTIQWFPFYTFFLLKALRRGLLKDILLGAIFAALCLYAELTFSVFLLFLTLIIVAGEVIFTHKDEPLGQLRPARRLARAGLGLCLMALLTFVFIAPFVLAVLPDFLDPAYAEPGWGEGLKLSADLAGLVTLTPLHPLAGLDWQTELRAVIEGTSRFSDANTLFLGYGILALALPGFLLYRRPGRVWLWSVIIFTILSLGPLLTINGQNRFDLDGLEVTFPLPFALLHYIPIINANRVPNRFGIPLTLALAVLVAFAAAWLLAKWPTSLITHHSSLVIRHFSRLLPTTFLLLLLLFDQYSLPLPLTDARIPEVYYQIGAEPDQFTLMQLPLGWRNSYGTLGAERTQLQYYQAAHRRPMLGGNTSRNPAFKFDYYANIPLFKALTEAELYQTPAEETLTRARSQAAELMTLYNIKYLVIHEPIAGRLPYLDTYFTTSRLALDLIPHRAEPVYQSPGVQAFAVEQAPLPDRLEIDFGTWPGDPYRGEGWAANEEIFAATANWATAPEAVIFLPVRGGGARHLALQIAPFTYPAAPQQQVQLWLNGRFLEEHHLLHEGWQTIETTLPETGLVQGLNRLKLQFAQTASPRQVLPANRAIGSTGLETPVDLELNSGPDFAFITVGFGDDAVDASAHRRGLNVAVLNPDTGQVIAVQGFDTAANEFEAAALRDFIAALPTGQIVLIAGQGPDALAFVETETIAALQTVGLVPDALNPPFSAIGVKGAAPGAALQSGDDGSAYLRLGAAPDTRALAAAVDKVIVINDK